MPSQFRINPDRALLIGVLAAAAVYCQDLRYDFILDDVPLILLNETLTSWRNWKIVFTSYIGFTRGPHLPVTSWAVHYRPAYVLWQMLNEHLFGLVLPWWHVTSLLLHIAVTFLVYQLGVQLLKERWTAVLAALLFALHPIHVESVSYVAASTDLLVALFALISFLAYSRFRERGGAPGYLIAAVFAAALAMLSKETAAMLPWILVAYEALRASPSDARGRWKQFVWTIPFFAVVGIYTVIRTLLFGPNLGPGPGGSRIAALLDAPLVLLVYLRNLWWPFRLSFFYPVEWSSQWTFWRASEIVLVLAVVVLLWNYYRDRSEVRLQLLWSAILFVPAVASVSAFVKEDWVHDRHMYLVSVPFCLIAAAMLRDPKFPPRASLVASALILAVLLVATAVQTPRFSDNGAIYASALRVAPRNVLAHSYYAGALWSYGHREEALREFRVTIELSPESAPAHESYAAALAQTGHDEEAAMEFTKALRLSPQPTPFRAFVLYELATIEVKQSRYAEGAAHMREALQISPQTPNYRVLLAQASRQ